MFIRTKVRSNGKIAVQIVESHRKANKISQRVVRHIGQGVNELEVDELKKLASSIIKRMENERKPSFPLFEPLDFVSPQKTRKDVPDSAKLKDMREEQRVIDGIGDVFGSLYDQLDFNRLITKTLKNQQWNGYLRTMVLARIANPVSKRRTASILEEDYGIKMSLEQIYRTLDHVYRCESDIKKHVAGKTLSLFKEEVDVLFFDVTTLYFESFIPDDLRASGFSKDNKINETQVVLALVTTTQGLPITYRLFPGNTYEGHTLLTMVDELSGEYQINKLMLVADRAMFTEENLTALEAKNITYIIAAKLRCMSKSKKASMQDPNSYTPRVDGEDLCWVNEFEHKGRRLIVEYSPARARKDAKDRSRLVERLLKKVRNGKIAIKEVIPNYGTKKYLKVSNEKVEIDTQKIEEDSQWDGLHGVITNADKSGGLSSFDVLARYRDLWRIEEAFRINKHDLKMRPIFHFTSRRIIAHVALCFIAYALIKQALFHLEQKGCPMSFERLRNALLHAQSSVLVDMQTNKKYLLPSKTTQDQRQIYTAFGLSRRDTPYLYE